MKRFFTCGIVTAVLTLLACGPLAQAAPTHTVEADASSVSITVGATDGEEVTLQIHSAGEAQPAFIDQVTADADGAAFSVPLPQGEYTYRAYLADAQEYVSGTFRIAPAQPSSTSTSVSSASSTSSAFRPSASSEPVASASSPAASESDDASSPSTGQSAAGLWTAGAVLLASLAALTVLKPIKKGERKNG